MCLAVINSIKTPKQYASHWGEQDLTKAGINKNKIYNVSQRMIYSPLSYAHNSLSSIESYQSKNLCYTIRKDLDSLQNAEFADRVDKEPKKSMGRFLSFFYKIGSLFPLLPTSNITDVEKTIFNLQEKINKMAYFPPSSEKDPTACKIRCAVLYAETNRIASYFEISHHKNTQQEYQEDATKYHLIMNQKLAISAKETRKTLDNIRIGLGFATTVVATAVTISIITPKTQ